MIINLKSQTDLAGFYIVYTGSVNMETEKELGANHLLEHLICKSFEHLHDEFETYGIDWNAFTSLNDIVFHFSGLNSYLKKYKNELVKLLSDFNIKKDDFINEKKIVIEEYKSTFNDQQTSHFLNLDRKIFNNFNPIGNLKSLSEFTYLDCINLFEKQFIKPSKIINVGDEFDMDIDFLNLKVDKEYKFLENNKTDLELNNDFKNKSSIVFLSPFIEKDFPYIHFINYMISSGLNSPLYKEVREERQLVYSISSMMRRMNNKGINLISTITSDDNVKEVIDTIKMILNPYNKNKYLTKERFDIVKDSIKINLKKQDIHRYSNINRWISPDNYSITPEFIDKVDYNYCKKVFDKYFNHEDYLISVDKEEFNSF